MKYKVTLNDSVELLILADSDVEAVRKAKSIKDALSNAKVNDLISMPWGDMDDLKRYAFHYGYKWIDVITGYENRTKGRGLTHEAAVEDLKNLMAAGKRLTDSTIEDSATSSQINYLRSLSKSLSVWADGLDRLARGQKVTGYNSTSEIVDELKILAKNILDVCTRIKD